MSKLVNGTLGKVFEHPDHKPGKVETSHMSPEDLQKYLSKYDIKPYQKPIESFNDLRVKKIREEEMEMREQKITKEQLMEELKDGQFNMVRYREIAAKYNLSINSLTSLVSYHGIKKALGFVEGKKESMPCMQESKPEDEKVIEQEEKISEEVVQPIQAPTVEESNQQALVVNSSLSSKFKSCTLYCSGKFADYKIDKLNGKFDIIELEENISLGDVDDFISEIQAARAMGI